MAGLLDIFNTDEGKLGLAMLAAAAPSMEPMNFAGRIANAGRGFQQMKQDDLKGQFIKSQISENASQEMLRKQQAEKSAQMQGLLGKMFGGASQETSPGAFQPSVDGMGPTMPPSMRAPQGGNGIAGMSIDQIAQLKALGGPDLLDAYKWVKDPLQFQQGNTYQDRTTGKMTYMPKVGEGVAADASGSYAPLPGYADAQGAIEGAKTRGVEAAKSGFDLVKVVGQDGAERYVPRSTVLGTPAPKGSGEAGMRTAAQGQMGADPMGIQREIAAVNADLQKPLDPASKALLTAHLAELQSAAKVTPPPTATPAGFQATPTTAQKVDEASSKAQAEAQGKDVAETRKSIMNSGFAAPSMISKYQQIGKLLENVDGGTLTATGTQLASTANSLGLKIDKNLPNKEAAAALGNAMALELRSPANGAGMPGAMSDADRNFLASMVPNASQSAQGRKQLIEANIAISKRNQDVAQFARNYEKKHGKLDNGFFDQMQAYANQNPLFGGK